jgi:glycosyltransferase involved in cell wall biosynthesis
LSRKVLHSTWSPEATTLRKLLGAVDAVLTCTSEEGRRLDGRIGADKLQVIPHFVERRAGTADPTAARRALGLEGVSVVTLMGFIYPYKGHELLVEALPHLPEDVRVIFAGGTHPRYEGFVRSLARLASEKGVAGRLRITGYLSEADLEQ